MQENSGGEKCVKGIEEGSGRDECIFYWYKLIIHHGVVMMMMMLCLVCFGTNQKLTACEDVRLLINFFLVYFYTGSGTGTGNGSGTTVKYQRKRS